MKYKIEILLLFVSLMPTLVLAQESKITIKGIIQSDKNEVLPGATIQLKNIDNYAPVKMAVPNLNGEFELELLKGDSCIIQITMVGFVQVIQTIIPISNINLGVITLKEDVKLLNEITITGAKTILESKPGMTIYNVSDDPMAIGKSLSDIALNLPGISQNGSGTLTYGGENQITILVNGRKSNINETDIVQQIQASNVDSMELITGADPRFASTTGSATINIVLKKNREKGVNGNTSLTTNNYGFINGSFNISRFSGRTNYYAFVSSDDRFLKMNTDYERRNKVADTILFSRYIRNSLNHSLRTLTTGIDFYTDSLNIITLEYNGSIHSDKMDAVTSQNNSQGFLSSTRILSGPEELENTLLANHQGRFKKPGRLLESEISITNFNMTNTKSFGDGENPEQLSLNNLALRIRSEFTTALANSSSLSFGVDYSNIKTRNMMKTLVSRTEKEFSSEFIYENQKAAIYGSWIFKPTIKFSLRPGLRLEKTKSVVHSSSFDGMTFDLIAIFPTLNALLELNKSNNISFDFIRKIQHPNPYSF